MPRGVPFDDVDLVVRATWRALAHGRSRVPTGVVARVSLLGSRLLPRRAIVWMAAPDAPPQARVEGLRPAHLECLWAPPGSDVVTTTLIPTLCAIVAALIVLGTTPLSARLARLVGAVDEPSDRRIHREPTPRLGGLAILAGLPGAGALLPARRPGDPRRRRRGGA